MALLLGIRYRQLKTHCRASLCRRLSTVGLKHLSERHFILEHEGILFYTQCSVYFRGNNLNLFSHKNLSTILGVSGRPCNTIEVTEQVAS